jgi:uncharacterized cupin superfamily protein
MENKMNITVKKLTNREIEEMGISSWPVWTKEVSTFDWFYDSEEQCLILEGRVIVSTDEGAVEINKGDFVVFPEGLSCVWDIKEAIRKHYNFK